MSKTATRRPRGRRASKPAGVTEPTLDGLPDEPVNTDEPTVFEYKLQGASGFKGAKNLKRGDEITTTVGGRVIAIETKLRKRHESGVGSVEEECVQTVTIKATGAFIRNDKEDETK